MLRLRACLVSLATLGAAAQPTVETVMDLGDNMPTGVAVTSGGRKFLCFPRWFADAPQFQAADYHVAELVAGKLLDYPSKAWNSWTPESPSIEGRFVNVQSVFADHLSRLWVLDVGAAYLANVTAGAPRLHRVDLATNAIVQTCAFNETYAPANSYLNDVRVGTDGRTAYLTNSNNGGLLVVRLDGGGDGDGGDGSGDGGCATRLVLADHPSTHAEPGVTLTVEGQPLTLAGTNGSAVSFQSDGLAVLNGYVWFHAVTAHTLWRVPEAVIADPAASDAAIAAALENMGGGSSPDGMVAAADDKLRGRLYLTAVEKDGVDWYDEARTALMPLVVDARLQWPDSAAVPTMGGGADGGATYLYVTASQVDALPFVAGAKPRRQPYGLYRVKLPAADIRRDVAAAAEAARAREELRE